jgi:hypothetical protein
MLTIAIPVYNRFELLKTMADSLYRMEIPIPYSIRIYDDCSTEFGVSELKRLFPNAVSIKRNAKNLRADKNMFNFYKDFLSSEGEYLFNADSDIIFNKNCVIRALELIRQTDGILSVYNSGWHPVKMIINEDLCIKETLGAAGTLFTRKRVEEIVNHFSSLDDDEMVSLDWKWSSFFTRNNTKMYCTNTSLVQHIGFYGQNSHRYCFDYGKNFIIDSIETAQAISTVFEKFVEQNRHKEQIDYNESELYRQQLEAAHARIAVLQSSTSRKTVGGVVQAIKRILKAPLAASIRFVLKRPALRAPLSRVLKLWPWLHWRLKRAAALKTVAPAFPQAYKTDRKHPEQNLPPHARRILKDLKAAVAQRQEGIR